MGEYLLEDLGISPERLDELDHRRFSQARTLVEQRGEQYFERATDRLQQALRRLYGEQPVSLQRLAATFRRGDLLEYLGPFPGHLFDDVDRDPDQDPELDA